MDTLTKSCSPTIVITANGEVQTHEEATVYVKELDIFLTVKVLENTPVVLSLGKLCDENGYFYERINGQKPHQIENGIRIQCNTENFVPIVVPGLSTSMTPSRHERHHSTSSSSSSSSPITATSSDSETREREDQSEIDSLPVPVSSSNVDDRTGDPLFADSGRASSEIPEWLQEFRENSVDDGVPEHTETHTPVLLMKYLQSPHARQVRIWVSTVFILISPKTEIARSVRGPKLQRPRAEDAMAEPYLVQKFLVT